MGRGRANIPLQMCTCSDVYAVGLKIGKAIISDLGGLETGVDVEREQY